MKNILKLILSFTAVVSILSSCKKDDIVHGSVDAYEVGSYLQYIGTPQASPALFDLASITTSTVSIDVRVIGSDAKSVNIYTGPNSDKSTWTLIKNVPFSDSGSLSVTGTELGTALGVDPETFSPGIVFTFYNEIVTTDDRLFSMDNTSSDFEAQTNYKMALEWSATIFCAYNGSVYDGNVEILNDDWADYSSGDIVVNGVEPGPGPNQITMRVYPSPSYGTAINPIIIDVDPETNVATVEKQVYGTYDGSPYGEFSVEGGGVVNSCEGTISLDLEHTVAAGTFGTYNLTIQVIP